MRVAAIIPARGGSKGIPKKNLVTVAGKPLLAWSIEQAKKAERIEDVFVSSDDNEILEVAEKYGAQLIKRPDELSSDKASSESAWIHAIDYVTTKHFEPDLICGMQATSPLRQSSDIDQAISLLESNKYDSLFSASEIEDFFIWGEKDGEFKSLNYDYTNRKRRQDIDKRFVENGSFYLFTPAGLKEHQNRLYGKIGLSVMEFWKSFEVDTPEGLAFVEMIMERFILSKEML